MDEIKLSRYFFYLRRAFLFYIPILIIITFQTIASDKRWSVLENFDIILLPGIAIMSILSLILGNLHNISFLGITISNYLFYYLIVLIFIKNNKKYKKIAHEKYPDDIFD